MKPLDLTGLETNLGSNDVVLSLWTLPSPTTITLKILPRLSSQTELLNRRQEKINDPVRNVLAKPVMHLPLLPSNPKRMKLKQTFARIGNGNNLNKTFIPPKREDIILGPLKSVQGKKRHSSRGVYNLRGHIMEEAVIRMKNFKQPTYRNALRSLPDRSHLINSAIGTQTRVARVRGEYSNQLDYSEFCWVQEKATVPHNARVLSVCWMASYGGSRDQHEEL